MDVPKKVPAEMWLRLNRLTRDQLRYLEHECLNVSMTVLGRQEALQAQLDRGNDVTEDEVRQFAMLTLKAVRLLLLAPPR